MSRTGLVRQKIQTHFLKVNINCEGCKQRVKKLLRKIEGVFSVYIDEEHQLVKVRGKVNPATLINKLIKSGKPAEFWSPNNQLQYLGNEIEFDDSHIGHGINFGYEGDDDDLGNFFPNNNFVENPQTYEADHSSTKETYLRAVHMGQKDEQQSIANNGYMMPMMDPNGFVGNYGDGLRRHEFGMFHEVPISRLPNYEHNNRQNVRNNLQQSNHDDISQSAYRSSYLEDRHNNGNMMVNYDNGYMYSYDTMAPPILNYMPHY